MAATVELLDFLAPGVAARPVDDKEQALAVAKGHRPGCLLPAEQDEAQALYAAWLLAMRMQQEVAIVVPAGVTMEKEGDLQRTFGNSAGTIDPMGFRARYDLLNDKCSRTVRVGGLVRGSKCFGGED